MNLSELELNWEDPYDFFSLGAKSVIAGLLISFLFMGTPLYIGLISFERYGGDPNKRGFYNQVISPLVSFRLHVISLEKVSILFLDVVNRMRSYASPVLFQRSNPSLAVHDGSSQQLGFLGLVAHNEQRNLSKLHCHVCSVALPILYSGCL